MNETISVEKRKPVYLSERYHSHLKSRAADYGMTLERLVAILIQLGLHQVDKDLINSEKVRQEKDGLRSGKRIEKLYNRFLTKPMWNKDGTLK
jgi:hypothetical protein